MTAKRRTRIRRVAVVTGTRAEYGLLTSTLAAVKRHPSLKLQLIVTGMHLLRKFGRTLDVIPGAPPDLRNPPPGCRFAPRCARAIDACRTQRPPFLGVIGSHRLACHNPAEVGHG